MATAGIIVGYATVAVALILGVLLSVVVFPRIVSAQERSTDHAVAAARNLGESIQVVAQREAIPPRSTRAVRGALTESGIDPAEVSVGFDGGSAKHATRSELSHEHWQLRVTSGVVGSACLTVPTTTTGSFSITRDICLTP